MAKIRNSKPKEVSGGYERLFGIPALGKLMSKVQSAVISSGNELERMMIERVSKIDNLDDFLKWEIMPEGVFIAPKSHVKKCKTLQFPQGEPDFLIFKRRGQKQECYVVELKDGHVFDTKKAEAEHRAMRSFIERNAQYLQYRVRCYFCAFNQNDKEAIVRGFKQKITMQEAITGREFCELLEIDYDAMVSARKGDQEDNICYFISELMHIEKLKDACIKRIRDDVL